VRKAKDLAKEHGREIGCYTVGVVTCRRTQKEAEEYHRHAIIENADFSAIDLILAMKNITPETKGMEEFQRQRRFYANGMGGLPIVGDPDQVAKTLADLSHAGVTGIGISLINYLAELPYVCDEVLPRLERMGLREKRRQPQYA
jgi:alkanesulfonate monooxygenase SsuD/methylene tetrahydromethanopterin reductase-like flavin-dependent oxidoreductase (luciferase family)